MKTIASVQQMSEWSRLCARQKRTIGFVPTMGFLHEGHLSLMQRGRQENDALVASIFVNPTQFGPNEDLKSYPRDPAGDSEKCAAAGVDALFVPSVQEMYSGDAHTFVDVQGISAPLCGASRPGHFRGVATVVLKLINIVKPDSIYFGQKDFQQLRVIQTMAEDLNLDVRVVPCPTVREHDGLAMSSRNAYLEPDQRRQAVCLYQALSAAKDLFESGRTDAAAYLEAMADRIAQEPDAAPDYISIVDPHSLEELREVRDDALAVLAVRIGKTRLIDNMLLERR